MPEVTTRTIYFYDCIGPCGQRRQTVRPEQLEEKICRKCKKLLSDKDQLQLFEEDTYVIHTAGA